jgi:prophage regulatory protein
MSLADRHVAAAPRILTLAGLRARGVFYSRQHLSRLEKQGSFPKRIRVSANRVAWLEGHIDRWIRERANESGVAIDHAGEA